MSSCGITKSKSEGGPTLYFGAPILARDVLLHTLTLEGQKQTIYVREECAIYLDGMPITQTQFNKLDPNVIDSILRGTTRNKKAMFVISRDAAGNKAVIEALSRFKSTATKLSSLKIVVISEEEKKQELEEDSP